MEDSLRRTNGICILLRAGFLYLALFLSIALSAIPCFADFRFAVIGDTQGYRDGVNKKVLETFMEQAKSEETGFIVFVGDLITGSEDSERHEEMFRAWKKIIEGYEIPVYIALGNHDITLESSEDMVRAIFEMPKNGPSALKELVYSFDYENAHFVIIDVEMYGNRHRLGDIQFEWLKGDLEKNEKDIVFIFGHEPAYPIAFHKEDSLSVYPSERDSMWQLFVENSVTAYFCGHEHLYNSSLHEGVYQIITGGGGGPLRVLTKQGGFHHFVLVDVGDDGRCEITVKNQDGEIKDRFLK